MKKIFDYQYFISAILGVHLRDINMESGVLDYLGVKKQDEYSQIEIPKKDGVRIISVIGAGSTLRQLQKKLNQNLFQEIPLAWAAKGFVKGISYQDFLLPHTGKKYFLRLDIRDFFGSITSELIIDSLSEFVVNSNLQKEIDDICTLNGTLPQGALTSPVISNIIFRTLDQRIMKYCQSIKKTREPNGTWRREDIVYTRYADDLLFSSDWFDFSRFPYFSNMISNILKSKGFSLNREKTYITHDEISLSGFVVNSSIHLSRSKMQFINSILYYFDGRSSCCSMKYFIDDSKVRDDDMLKNVNKL